MNSKIFSIFICILILFTISSSGCFGNDKKGTEEIDDEYKLIIQPIGFNETFIVYTPIVIENNGEKAEIMDNLEIIQGSGNFEIIETKYGNALKVEGNREINMVAKYSKTKKNVDHPGNAYREKYFCWELGLSMNENESVPDFIEIEEHTVKIADLWIYVELQHSYFNNNSINITLELNRDHLYKREICSGGVVDDKVNIITSKQGWQQVDLFRTPVAYI